MGRGRPIGERSTLGVVWLFIVVPLLLGGIMLAVMIGLAVREASDRSLTVKLTELSCGALIALGVMITLPAVGIAELRRRRLAREAEKSQR
jgi:hypothetical protein